MVLIYKKRRRNEGRQFHIWGDSLTLSWSTEALSTALCCTKILTFMSRDDGGKVLSLHGQGCCSVRHFV